MLPTCAIPSLRVRSLLSYEEFVDVLHVHAHAHGADARHPCQIKLVRSLEVHRRLVAVLLAPNSGCVTLTGCLLLAAGAELSDDLSSTSWTLVPLCHFLLDEAGDHFGLATLGTGGSGTATLIAASFVVQLAVALADVTCSRGHTKDLILYLAASLARLKVAIVGQAARLSMLWMRPASLPLIAEGSRSPRVLVRCRTLVVGTIPSDVQPSLTRIHHLVLTCATMVLATISRRRAALHLLMRLALLLAEVNALLIQYDDAIRALSHLDRLRLVVLRRQLRVTDQLLPLLLLAVHDLLPASLANGCHLILEYHHVVAPGSKLLVGALGGVLHASDVRAMPLAEGADHPIRFGGGTVLVQLLKLASLVVRWLELLRSG